MKITKTAIDGMKFEGRTPKARDLRWDDELPGFGVRIWPSGKKSFFIEYRHMGRPRYMTIGPYGVLTLHQARDLARQAKVRVLAGKDPLAERQARNEGKTFGDLAAEYLKRHAVHKKSGRDDELVINRLLLPAWRTRPLATIRSSDVAQLHHKIGDGAPVLANRVVSLLSKMFNLGKKWGYVGESATNPAHGIERNRERQRERFVSPEEMKRLAAAIDASGNLFIRAVLWSYLFTGARKSELLRLKWSDVDFDRREVTLRDTKAGNTHVLPLTTHLEAVLAPLPRISKNPYVFCGRKGSHLKNIDNTWKNIRIAAKLEDVWIHDLRRTVATWIVNAGYSLALIGRVLNHANPQTTQRYARHQLGPATIALEDHGNRVFAALKADDGHHAPPSGSDAPESVPGPR